MLCEAEGCTETLGTTVRWASRGEGRCEGVQGPGWTEWMRENPSQNTSRCVGAGESESPPEVAGRGILGLQDRLGC